MKILAIETSCDETSVSLLNARYRRLQILSNIISSQVKVHRKWGGVVPTLAKREHQKNLAPVLMKALREAGILRRAKIIIKNSKLKEILIREECLYKKLKKFLEQYQKPKIDLIAVTIGPALEPALWVGVNFAKALSYFWQKPILPVNHIEAHIFANFIQNPITEIQFPAICLVVSGGHTGLILMKGVGEYREIGETRDDTAGECFDKAARILGLGYPGGPIVAAEAAKFPISNFQFSIKLPRPMMHTKDYDFSFSGLKTAVLYDFRNRAPNVQKSKKYIKEMCFETQQAIIDVLIHKALKAARDFKAKSIILGGGVAANDELRKQFNYQLKTRNYKLNFLVPPKNLCTDNAAMVAVTAYFHRKTAAKDWQKIEVNANLKI